MSEVLESVQNTARKLVAGNTVETMQPKPLVMLNGQEQFDENSNFNGQPVFPYVPLPKENLEGYAEESSILPSPEKSPEVSSEDTGNTEGIYVETNTPEFLLGKISFLFEEVQELRDKVELLESRIAKYNLGAPHKVPTLEGPRKVHYPHRN